MAARGITVQTIVRREVAVPGKQDLQDMVRQALEGIRKGGRAGAGTRLCSVRVVTQVRRG